MYMDIDCEIHILSFCHFDSIQLDNNSLAADCKSDGISRKAPPPQGTLPWNLNCNLSESEAISSLNFKFLICCFV